MSLGKFDQIHISSMGAGSILCRDYDWIGIALATNENTSDVSVFSRGGSVPAEDGKSTGQACIVESLL